MRNESFKVLKRIKFLSNFILITFIYINDHLHTYIYYIYIYLLRFNMKGKKIIMKHRL